MSNRLIIRCGAGQRTFRRVRPASGFTLVELMIAMVLGLIVIAGVASVFVANQQVYRTNRALGDVQDGSRVAFETMARDIRNAGLTGCDNSQSVANVLYNSPTGGGTDWWANWGNVMHGYGGTQGDPATGSAFGTVALTRVTATDSLMVLGAANSGLGVASHNPVTTQFTLNQTSQDMQVGDVMVVCDPDHAAIFQITGYTKASKTLNNISAIC